MSAPTEIPVGFKHVGKPKPTAVEPLPQDDVGFDPADPFGEKPISDELAAHKKRVNDAYEAERQWQLQDDRDRESQWRYAWADSMLAARGERGRVDDIIQAAQTILPALLQSHALRQPEDPDAEDLVGEGFELGWGAPGADVTFIDDHAGERASIAENLAFDACLLAEAFIEVRRRRYGV